VSSVETVTILITDLVGSTGLESRLGPAAADELRHDHFRMLREAIGETGGAEVKNTGDGLMVAFRSASAAVDCAIAMQQRMTRRNRSSREPLHVRVGVGLGDATVEDGDYFGMPSIEAARLCDKASADGILVTDMVRLMARRAGEVFTPVGQLSLKGIPEPVSAFEVHWERTEARGGLPLPPGLSSEPELRAVGRATEQAVLETAWNAAAAGTGRVVLVAGEPGIGKTRLIAEAARGAHRDGATVLFGHCEQQDLGAPYQVFADALRHYLMGCLPARLAPLSEHSRILARLVPEAAHRLPAPARPVREERRSEQRLTFDAIVKVVITASRHAPVVLVLDDIQWAAEPALDVLRQLARESESRSLLLLGAYRDTEVGSDHPMVELLVELRRKGRVERVVLRGLSDDEAAELVDAAWPNSSDHDPDLSRELRKATGGSPFLMSELIRQLAASGAGSDRLASFLEPGEDGPIDLPESVTDSIRARRMRLSELANRALDVAAVSSHGFEATLVAEVAGVSDVETLAALDEALAAGLVREQPGAAAGFTFANAVVRQAIYRELPIPRRVSLHRAIAERLEATDSDRHDDLAEHWFAATAPAGATAHQLAKAIDYAELAAQDAERERAFSLAGRHYRHAARLVEATDAGSRRHCEFLLAMGGAYSRSYEISDAKEAFRRAAVIARRRGERELLARAALGYGLGPGDSLYVAAIDDSLVGLLEEALGDMGGERNVLHVRVLSRLVVELHATGFVDRRESLGREAVKLAEALGDGEARLVALYSWLRASWSPDELAGRIAGSDEVIRVAHELDDLEMLYRGHAMKLHALLEIGDMDGTDRQIETLDQTAVAIGQPLFEWRSGLYRAMRSLHAGDTEDGDRLMLEAFEVGRRVDAEMAGRGLAAQAALARWVSGKPRELIPVLRDGVEGCPWLPVRRARLAFGLAELGRKTEASAEFERLVQDDFASLLRDGNWLLTMGFLSFTCGLLGDQARAVLLADAIAPYADRFFVSGDTTSTWGPVATALAVLEATMRHYDHAGDWFERALESNRATGAAAQTVFTQREYARMLLARGRPGDGARGRSLLDDAAAASRLHRFEGLADHVLALRRAADAV
jgi:class 3 adenylate cyclase/tetratricopeptide (TPR) repeat protein